MTTTALVKGPVESLMEKGFQVSETPYAGGVNYVIRHGMLAVSVCHTDWGLWDVVCNGSVKPLYTGFDAQEAVQVCVNYLKR